MNHERRIIIIGAGVFGLSTALHLARRGYTNIHLYDSQDYASNAYRSSVSASCDENKIIRASYGDSVLYRDLAFEAIDEWEKWNAESGKTLWNRCGLLRIEEELSEGEKRTQVNLPEAVKGLQYRVTDVGERRRAEGGGVAATKLDPLGRLEKGLPTDGYLDGTAGFVMASEACEFALHLCRETGVETHFGPSNGVASLLKAENKVLGILTADGTSHPADLVIVGCGGWTPSFLPEVEDLIETTAGSIVTFRLPPHRKDLWEKLAPENFPVWCWNMSSYDREKRRVAGIFGFPRTVEGVVKLCFTGAQWTNYTHRSQASDRLISFPRTETDGKIPEEAMLALRSFCEENLPELLDLEPEQCRLCWYSDSVDENFLIDYVPGTEGLMVCSGGSGHGFKFLPVLGKHVVDVVEGRETAYTRMFSWRGVPEGKRALVEEGPRGWQGLGRQRMVDKSLWRAL